MTTRLFEFSLSVPCENAEAEAAVTEAVIAVARQLYAVSAMLAWQGKPRLRLSYMSPRTGRVEQTITDETPPLITGDSIESLRGE